MRKTGQNWSVRSSGLLHFIGYQAATGIGQIRQSITTAEAMYFVVSCGVRRQDSVLRSRLHTLRDAARALPMLLSDGDKTHCMYFMGLARRLAPL